MDDLPAAGDRGQEQDHRDDAGAHADEDSATRPASKLGRPAFETPPSGRAAADSLLAFSSVAASLVFALGLLGVAQTSLPVVPVDRPIVLGVGETALAEARIPVRRHRLATVPAPSEITARPRAPSRGEAAELSPWIEVVRADARTVTIRVPIFGVRAGRASLRFGVEVHERGSDDPVALRPIVLNITVQPRAATAAAIDEQVAAWRHHDRAARAAHGALGPLSKTLDPNVLVAAPPSATVDDDETKPLAEFLGHRLRATAARRALRAYADDSDPALAQRAIVAVGSLRSNAVDTKIIDRVANAEAIALIAEAVDDLEIDAAMGYADALLASERLDPRELATVIALRGLAQLARGEEERARRALGRAFCLVRDLEVDVKRPWFVEAIAAAKDDERCPRALAVQKVVATRVDGDDGPRLEVVATFGPDPYQLVTKGKIQLWTYEGSLATSMSATALHVAEPRIEASLGGIDAERDGYVLMKIFLEEANGIEVASLGDPDPLAVPVVGDQGFEVPWWIWAVAGGAVVAAGATVGVVALSRGGEIDRRIGPVDVRF